MRKMLQAHQGPGSNLRSSFIAMGFAQSLVNRVIEEKGEDDADLILETLFAYSNPQSESSDSLDGLFSDNKDYITAESHPEEVLRKPCSESLDSLDGYGLFGEGHKLFCRHCRRYMSERGVFGMTVV